MQTPILLALALVVRSLPFVDGAVDFAPGPGQQVVAAYSVYLEPIWHHGVPTSVVDRLEAVRSGHVSDAGQANRLVVALTDEGAQFDRSRPLPSEPEVFPYSPELVQAYEKDPGRRYFRDMMAVAVPFLGSHELRSMAVVDLYEALSGLDNAQASPVRSEGPGDAGSVLVVTGRARPWYRLERCCGDDGSAYAKRLAGKGYRAYVADASVVGRLSVDGDGFLCLDGSRCQTMVLRHLSYRDARAFRRFLGTRPLRTKVYATNSPVVYGAELTVLDPELD